MLALLTLLAAHALSACGGCDQPAPGAQVAVPPTAEPPVATALEPVPPVVVKKAPPAAGFSFVKIENRLPLCVFADYQRWFETKFLHSVRAQKLEAKHSVVLGAFGPWCVHETCDQRPSLQCHVEREGNTLVVTSRYWGEHKDGARCKDDCKSMTAACETQALEAGTYTVQHGGASFTFELPSLLREPCFGDEMEPPPPGATPPEPEPTPTAAP